MNTAGYTALVQRLEDLQKENTQLKLKLREQAVIDKQLLNTGTMQAFLDDYEDIKRVLRYGI